MYFAFCRKPVPTGKPKGEYVLCTRTVFSDSEIDTYIQTIPCELEPIKILASEIFRSANGEQKNG